MTTQQRQVHIFGVPMDLGQQRRGVDMGPSALRYAGLAESLRRLDYAVSDSGNLRVPIAEQIDQTPHDGTAHNVEAIADVCKDIYASATTALATSDVVIALGGDHTVALGTISAALEGDETLGIVWIDAHADFNTAETTLTGNVHGMVVAALMGHCPPLLRMGRVCLTPAQIVMIAIRDLDPAERQRLREYGVLVLTMSEIDKVGIKATAEAALQHLSAATRLHVSFDLDSLDPTLAPGVGTPVAGGLTYREAHLLMEMLAEDGRVRSVDVVEVNPILDDKNKSSMMAVELVCSLLGKRIL